MSQIQQGRAKAKRMFKKLKNFKKAQEDADAVFNDKNTTAAQTKEWDEKYSRVTHSIIGKKHKA